MDPTTKKPLTAKSKKKDTEKAEKLKSYGANRDERRKTRQKMLEGLMYPTLDRQEIPASLKVSHVESTAQ